jgi:beta-mannanase
MISWAAGNETRLGEILAGTHDDWIAAQVTELGALGVPVLMRFTWEFDLRYVNTGLFKDVWRYVRWKFKAGAPNVEFVWCPTWRAYRETNKADAFYPEDAHVDWIAADGYARRNLEKPDYHYRAFNLMFDTAHRFATDHRKPFMVGETGVNRDDVNPVQAAWLTETHAAILAGFPNLKAFVYFHRDGTEEDEHWRVDVPDGGPAQDAFTAMATDPYFSAS